MSPTRRLLILLAVAGLARSRDRRIAARALRQSSRRVRRETALRLARLRRAA